MVPPLELSGRGLGGGTIWRNNCQNSLKTRLKYIKIALKVDFYEKNLALALIEFFQRGARKFFALCKFTKKQRIFQRGACIRQTQTVEESVTCADGGRIIE